MLRLTRLLPRVGLAVTPWLATALAPPSRAASSAASPDTLRVGVCQMMVGADKDANIERAAGLLARACDGGADVVVLPEVWNSPRARARKVCEAVRVAVTTAGRRRRFCDPRLSRGVAATRRRSGGRDASDAPTAPPRRGRLATAPPRQHASGAGTPSTSSGRTRRPCRRRAGPRTERRSSRPCLIL